VPALVHREQRRRDQRGRPVFRAAELDDPGIEPPRLGEKILRAHFRKLLMDLYYT